MRELCSHLGRHQAKPLDAEAEKRAGWRRARHPGGRRAGSAPDLARAGAGPAARRQALRPRGRRATDERPDQAAQGLAAGSWKRSARLIPTAGRCSTIESSIRLRGCGARARLRMPCTMLRGTSKRPSSSRNLEPLRALPMLRVPGAGRAPDLHEHQLDARRRVHEALEALGGINSPAGSCAWHVVGCERSLRDWALRQRWSGRPLPQGHAQGILVATLGILAARADSAPPSRLRLMLFNARCRLIG